MSAAEAAARQATPAAAAATPAQMAEIRRLVQIIARLFYDDGHIVLMDQLVSIAAIPAEVLARRVGLQSRDLGSLAAKLVEDRMLSVYRCQESKEGVFHRTFARTYYYLDYKHFLDVTKWRMMAMRRHIDNKLRNGLDNKGYVCPRCKHSYSTLEVAHLLDLSRNMFVCEVPGCGTELVDNEDAEDVRKSKDTLTRFNEQLSVVQQALRSVEGVALPPMDIHAWLAKHGAAPPWQDEAPRDDTALPPSTAPAPAPKAPTVRVELANTDPITELKQQQQRAQEEEEQRAQNTIPTWHLASTVSGEHTGLGRAMAEQRIADSQAQHTAAQPDQAVGDEDAECTYLGLALTQTLRSIRHSWRAMPSGKPRLPPRSSPRRSAPRRKRPTPRAARTTISIWKMSFSVHYSFTGMDTQGLLYRQRHHALDGATTNRTCIVRPGRAPLLQVVRPRLLHTVAHANGAFQTQGVCAREEQRNGWLRHANGALAFGVEVCEQSCVD